MEYQLLWRANAPRQPEATKRATRANTWTTSSTQAKETMAGFTNACRNFDRVEPRESVRLFLLG